MMEALKQEAREHETPIVVNALDLMYFWMYQPRSRKTIAGIVHSMAKEERLIF